MQKPIAFAWGVEQTDWRTAPKTLIEMLERAVAGGRGIVHIRPNGDEIYQSYAELLSSAQRVLGAFRARGLQPGDKVVVEVQDASLFLPVFWGCILGGFLAAPMHTPTSLRPDSNAMDEPLLVCDGYMEENYLSLKEHPLFSSQQVVSAEALMEHEPDTNYHETDPDDLAFLQFSTTSTGNAKGNERTHSNIITSCGSVAQMHEHTEHDIFSNWMPLCQDMDLMDFHLMGVMNGLNQLQMSPGTFLTRVELIQLFENPTNEQLAMYVNQAVRATMRSNATEYELSSNQRGMWFIQQMNPESVAYNEEHLMKITGELDVIAFGQALSEIVERNAILRTVFVARDGRPKQVVLDQGDAELAFFEGADLPAVEKALHADLSTPFDLSQGPLIRFKLFQTGEQEFYFCLVAHHIIFDGVTLDILYRELSAVYSAKLQGQPSLLPPVKMQYADFAEWQLQQLNTPKFQKMQNYWRESLVKPLPVLDLPIDFPRPPQNSDQGATIHHPLSVALTQQLLQVCEKTNASLYMVMLSAYFVWLHRMTHDEDIIVGAPLRNRTERDVRDAMGYFVNTLPVRINMDGDATFHDVLNRVRKRLLAVMKHQGYPFDLLVEEVNPDRDPSRPVLLSTLFDFLTPPMAQMEGLNLTVMDSYKVSSISDLTWNVMNKQDHVHLGVVYNATLFQHETIQRFVKQYENILQAIVQDFNAPIREVEMLTELDRDMYEHLNDTSAEYDLDHLLIDAFVEQAEAHPERVALVCEGRMMTYGELHERSNRLAHFLRAQGVMRNQLVAIMMERSFELMIGLYGILKSGGAYVPIDPEYPADRIEYMLADSGARVLLTKQAHVDAMLDVSTVLLMEDEPNMAPEAVPRAVVWRDLADLPTTMPEPVNVPSDLAYMIYTSGSTGQPKGVLIQHMAILNRLHWHQDKFGCTPDDVVVQRTTMCFDDSVIELFWPLRHGAALSIMSQDVVLDPKRMIDQLNRDHATYMQFVPSLLSVVVTVLQELSTEDRPKLRAIIVSGEALPPHLLQQWFDLFPGTRMANLYGPTEAAVDVTGAIYEAPTTQITIGTPTANTQIYVLDANGQLCPVNVKGELYIGGVQLAVGYHNKPEKTAEAFVPNHLPGTPGDRLYRTGDAVRLLPNGNIEYLGRSDDQVKIRGMRIELGEIESALVQHESVREAVVVVHEVAGDKRLAAYLVLDGEPSADVTLWQAHLREQLPAYMVPAAFTVLEAMPLTPNGKVDRKALPTPDATAFHQEYVPPRTAVEEVLAGVWADVLRVQKIGVHDNFFEIGGHSLLATQVVSRVRQTLAIELALRDLFELPTVAELATRVDEHALAQSNDEMPRIIPIERSVHMPLSFAQQRLWLVEQLVPDTPLYNMPYAFRITDRLDKRALVQSLNEIVKRHEVLRTTFVETDGAPMQVIAEQHWQPLTIVDLQAMPAALREQEWPKYLEAEAWRLFDLRTGPLCRFTLIQLDEGDHVLLLNLHHIVSDGWSTSVFLRELAAFYHGFSTGQPSPLPPLSIQYADYGVWQRQWLQGEVLKKQLTYWKQQLGGQLPILQLPTDRPRPPVQTHRGNMVTFVIDPEVRHGLHALSQQEGATLFMVLLAAYQLLLSRYSGQDDILVGTPIGGRNHKETEDLIGFFVNTLVMRTNLAGAPSFLELLARVREVALGAYMHQDVPFEKLVEELKPERDMSRTPLFQTMFAMLNDSLDEVEVSGLTFRQVSTGNRVAKFDLTFSLVDEQEKIKGFVEYNTDLYDPATIERMIGHFQTLLQQIVRTPEQAIVDLSLLDEQERQQLLVEFNNTDAALPEEITIHERFYQQVDAHPHNLAVSDGRTTLTYEQLNERSNQLAWMLNAQGVQPGQRIALLLGRNADTIMAMLAVLKVGAAYVPIDPDYPEERIRYMLSDSDAALVLTCRTVSSPIADPNQNVLFLEDVDQAAPDNNLPVTTTSEDLAYVIYTSGSTGLPKGTQLAHRGVINLAQWKHDQFGYGDQDVILQFASYSFDASVFEIFPALLNGAHLHILTGSERQSAEEFAQAVRRTQATICTLPTVFFKLLSTYLPDEDLDHLHSLRTIFVAGEALLPEVVRSWQRRMGLTIQIVNAYGPSESTVCASAFPIQEGVSDGQSSIPIGKPIANTKLYILDAHKQPCPINVVGELYIESIGLAIGYLNQPEKTSEAFLPHPFADADGKRIYRTGDLVRRLPDGNIEYVGRRDTQIKVRGHRIEIGELEEVLMQHAAVEVAAAVPQPDADGNTLIHVYYTAHGTVHSEELKSFLVQKLPAYMMPASFRQVETMPLSPSGKVDRKVLVTLKTLPKPNASTNRSVSRLQKDILTIWSQALERDDISVNDNFFDIGGHSLLLAKVRDALKRDLQLDIPFVELFKNPTVQLLTDSLAKSDEPLEPMADRQFERENIEQGESIAIIGMALRFPEASTPYEYWNNLREGRLSVREFPEEELMNAPDDPELRKEIVRACGLLDDVDKFDASFFQISEREAKMMSPQHRLFLECAWEAFEDAGMNVDTIKGTVSVYAGAGSNDYIPSGVRIPNFSRSELFQASLSSLPKFVATRVSYKLNLTGESLSVDTACSTSLVAVHMACQSLLRGHSDYALAGGVSIQMAQKEGYAYEPSFIMSPDGQCRAFDKDANGTAIGSGAGVVLLKRLSDAVRDGDAIYAIIKGSAINNDGNLKIGYTAPSQRGQAEVIASAQASAGIRSEEITFVEAHGTGTHLGDQIEVAALKDIFGATSERPYCALGSVKTNIGHLDAAAGVASLIKATLAVYHGEIPPTVNFQEPNPELGLETSPFFINTTVQPWTNGGKPRRAGVSSFGIGGTNAHVILEEAPLDDSTEEVPH